MSAAPGIPQSDSSLTLVCFALKEEAAAFRKLAAHLPDVRILLTGIGKQNSERAVLDFLRLHKPSRVFSCGFAGALDPSLKIGDVVFLTVDWLMDKSLVAAGARPVSFHCAPHMVTTASAKAKLWKESQAHVVEMESHFIHLVCLEHGIDYATVRVISDVADEDLPLDFNQLCNPDQSLNFAKLGWAVAKSPGKIPALLRLQKNSKLAAERLAVVLKQVIDQKLPPLER